MSAFKTWLTGLSSKATPVDADELYVLNSVGTASNKLTWANIKTTLLAYFDTAYLKLTGGTIAGGTRTTSGSTLTITETLNDAGVTFPGALVVNVTDTASDAASLLADFKVGGVSKFKVAKDGTMTVPAMNSYASYATTYLSTGGNGSYIGSDGFFAASTNPFAFSSTTNCFGTPDVVLRRDAAGTLAQRNSTNAQTNRLYGTYTDASNGRWLETAVTTAGVASITPTGNGTGASGSVLHISGLPTSNPGAGILWNDTGTVKVGT